MRIFNLLDSDQVDRLRRQIEPLELEDGKTTAKGHNRTIKNNLQITAANKHAIPIFNDVITAMKAKGSLVEYASPRDIAGIQIASYGVGAHYGWHVDYAHMGGKRTDLSFTLFLSDADEYDGGELEFDHGTHRTEVKGTKGQIVVYSTGILHRVKEVTRGERLCCVGWIQSLIPDPNDREILYQFGNELKRLRKAVKEPEDLTELGRVLQYFIRRSSD